jgi:solute carrier family 25 phosphate transporter 3
MDLFFFMKCCLLAVYCGPAVIVESLCCKLKLFVVLLVNWTFAEMILCFM